MRIKPKWIVRIFWLISLLACSPDAFADNHWRSGVIDRSGKTIIPCNYESISYLGKGLFYAENRNEKDPLLRSFQGVVFDHLGQIIPVSLPQGCSLVGVVFDKSGDEETTLTTLPGDSIFLIRGPKGFGISDVNGNVVLPPEFPAIHFRKPNVYGVYASYPTYPWTKILFEFDITSRQRVLVEDKSKDWDKQPSKSVNLSVETPESRCAKFGFGLTKLKSANEPYKYHLTKFNDSEVEPPIFGLYYPVSRDLVVKTLRWRHFDKATWSNPIGYMNPFWDRSNELRYFLQDYDLIGMSKEQIENLLGKAKLDSKNHCWFYSLVGGGCGDSMSFFLLSFKKNRVERWCITHNPLTPKQQWLTTNMIYTPEWEDHSGASELIPKHISSE